jgi:hypothetical protein
MKDIYGNDNNDEAILREVEAEERNTTPVRPATIKLKFPVKIKQVDDRVIEITLPVADSPLFTKEAFAMAAKQMGHTRADALFEDIGDEMLRRMILDGVR